MKILISGSSSGIGKAITDRMLAEQYTVIGLARHHDKYNPNSPHYLTYKIDFSQINCLEDHLKVIKRGHLDLDVIVCSAGYGEFAELEQFSVKNMQTMLNVNFLSQAILIKTFLPLFKKKKSGKVIIIGSECALEGQRKASMYCASKFALRGFAQSIRKESATAGITVTLINPGLVATPFYDKLSFRPSDDYEHAILPTQVAHLVNQIISEQSNCVYEEINLQPMKKVIKKNQVNNATIKD